MNPIVSTAVAPLIGFSYLSGTPHSSICDIEWPDTLRLPIRSNGDRPRPYRRNTFLSTVGVKPSSAPLLSGSLQKCSCSSLKCAPEPLPQSRSGPWFHRDEDRKSVV